MDEARDRGCAPSDTVDAVNAHATAPSSAGDISDPHAVTMLSLIDTQICRSRLWMICTPLQDSGCLSRNSIACSGPHHQRRLRKIRSPGHA
jgi:hypothetical protein